MKLQNNERLVATRHPGAFSSLRLFSSAAMMLVLSAQAMAQTAADSKSDPLEEVIVTARKRAETMQSIPESVNALGSQELADAHVTKIDDLGNLVSNLNITTRADSTPDVVLRGVGSFGVVNGVGFYANDVQLFDGQTVRPEDLERVEVLKGPQGTLYGGSNIGGAIKYITKLPTDDFEGEASVEYGNHDTKTFSGVLSGPLVPHMLDGRVSFYGNTTDGYIYDTALNRVIDKGNERGGRATLKYDADGTTAILYVDGDLYRTGGANLYYTPSSPTDYSLNVADGTLPVLTRSLYSATLNVDHQFAGGIDLTSISSFFKSYSNVTTDIDKGPLPFLAGYQDFNRQVWSEELGLQNSGEGPFKWLIGLVAQANDPNLYTTTKTFTGDPSNSANFADPTQYALQNTDLHQRHREYAVFGNGSYNWDKWTFELGLRGDYNDSSMVDRLWGLEETQKGIEVLPKFSVSYHFEPDVMGYTTISRGFEPGDLTENFDANGNPVLARYKPETTWNYEVGVKSTLFDRIRLNAAAFYIDYGARLFQTYQLQSSQFVQIIENIGASHNYGAEFDASARIWRELHLGVGFGVTKAVWDNVPFYDSDFGQQTNLQGRTAPFTPEYQGSISLDWTHPLTDDLTFGARADITFVGRQYWDVTDHYQQPAYQLVNLGARLEQNSWTLSGHVSNLLDTRYNTTYISAAELQAPFNVAGIGRPRLWTLTATYRF